MVASINASTSAGVVVTSDTSGSLALQTNSGVTALTIDTSQNVGIGTSSPNIGGANSSNEIVTIVGKASTRNGIIELGNYGTTGNDQTLGWTRYFDSTTENAAIEVARASSTSTAYMKFSTNGGSGNTERMRIDSSGNLCINSTSVVGAEKLGVKFDGSTINGIGVQTTASSSGDGFVVFRNSAGTAIGTISRVSTTNAVAYNTTSDQRLKSNIQNADPVLDKLMQVQVRQYDWTEGATHQDYGFIAQELESTFSGVVTRGKTDEDMWQLDYAKLTPHLVKAIQEQQALIQTLQTQVAQLQAKVGV